MILFILSYLLELKVRGKQAEDLGMALQARACLLLLLSPPL